MVFLDVECCRLDGRVPQLRAVGFSDGGEANSAKPPVTMFARRNAMPGRIVFLEKIVQRKILLLQ